MNAIIRTAVVALALTGSAAYVNLSTVSASAKPVLAKSSWAPVPMCPPRRQTHLRHVVTGVHWSRNYLLAPA